MNPFEWLWAQAVGVITLILSDPWYLVGFFGQFFFMMRFLVQWVSSERQRRSIIPLAFWFFSIGGGLVLLSYAIYRQDPVFIAGQGLGLLIYARNLYFILWVNRPNAPASDERWVKQAVEALSARVHGSRDMAAETAAIREKIDELTAALDRIDAAASEAPAANV